ncbi:hypothetical protein [Aquimarina algicola]|uniref:Uncharacterized protein n=1 Tax=Aquimarina algicola TaxID=2589995 RepID=A0A504JBR1_9FLAO|nr:hypothetical protein [Aquimarina algicola]TPN85982.1 hypothetical protein FHK87_11920 [Aquimarina algicola]
MEERQKCEETIGLFVLRTCDAIKVYNCMKCGKPICRVHAFKPLTNNGASGGDQKLCLSCFTEEDTRLTKDIELYSKDRYVWRRKMIERFHREYEYMTFIAEDYGSLFMGHDHYDYYDDTDDSTSYFDS